MHHAPSRRLLAAALATAILSTAGPARAAAVMMFPNGTFWPKHVQINNGDTVTWYGMTRYDGLARLAPSVIAEVASGTADPAEVCGETDRLDPTHVNRYQQAFAADALDPTGPDRFGQSGIWALGPEGGAVSNIAIPSDEAEALVPGLTARIAAGEVPDCDVLEAAVADATPVPDDPNTPDDESQLYVLRTIYDRVRTQSGRAREANQPHTLSWSIVGADGGQHILCNANYALCPVADIDGNGDADPADLDGDGDYDEDGGDDGIKCVPVAPDPAAPVTLPPGTYLNGLLSSTYANPDITGVVLRFNWSDLQYDDGGTITERWEHLDRELERAIASGKRVTLDVRAGMFGTPAWIFDGYLTPDDPADDEPASYHASWCASSPCSFTSAHASAGQVTPLAFVDHYDETPPGNGCGSLVRIGGPGDPHYRALYQDFMAKLAAHVASDTRWFQAVAHVKVSGANLRTSEAELPHHCDDEFANTGDYQPDPKANYPLEGGDRILDTFKTLKTNGGREFAACMCNTKAWWDLGYTPDQLYDYYAELEQTIVTSFFGRKSLGYQIIQDGFPRADATQSFLGDDLYEEVLTKLGNRTVNQGYADGATCVTPDAEVDDASGAPLYCSTDEVVPAVHVAMEVVPLAPDPLNNAVAAYATRDNSGGRYPSAFEQSETVLGQAASGRFADPYGLAGGADHLAGKLFVPQHSGLQPLPQERVDLDYSLEPTVTGCLQERPRLDVTGVWWNWAATAVGGIVAEFPIPNFHPISELSDPDTAGCPNRWIVEAGTDQGYYLASPFPFLLPTPPQLTGFQTTNAVRSPEMVESSLLNLVYNTNGVFVELYEDALWRIATLRGQGPSAAPLDADGVRASHCTVGVDYYCYSKNLRQWAEELHARRAAAAVMYQSFLGEDYAALAPPLWLEYSHTFVNATGVTQDVAVINPSRCQAGLVSTGNGVPAALGVVRVGP